MKHRTFLTLMACMVAGIALQANDAVSDRQYACKYTQHSKIRFEKNRLELLKSVDNFNPLKLLFPGAAAAWLWVTFGSDPDNTTVLVSRGAMAGLIGYALHHMGTLKTWTEPVLAFDNCGLLDCESGKYLLLWGQYSRAEISDEYVTVHHPARTTTRYRNEYRQNGYFDHHDVEDVVEYEPARTEKYYAGQRVTFYGHHNERLWSITNKTYAWLPMSFTDFINTVEFYKSRYGKK